MTELALDQIKKRSMSGIIALIQRSFLLQVITAISTFILAYYLDSRIFGVFGVVNAMIGFLAYFSDVGLAAALIQKKNALTPKDLATTFTIQQLLVASLLVIGFLLTPLVKQWYGLDNVSVWLYWSLLFSFFISSLKTIPSILLERKLNFQKLIIPQILETFVFNVVAVFLAWKGFGVMSFAWAVLLRAITGLVSLYLIAPWRIQVGISLPVAKELFRFGIPFQSNSLLALVKDDLLFLVLGKVITLEQLGYIFLAKRLAELPLRSIMDNVMRVTFPAFSRLQHDLKTLVSALEKTVYGIAIIVFPLFIGMMFFIQPFIELVPKYQKWQPALLSFYFLCVTSIAASLSTPLTNALNAIGKIKITLGLMLLWISLTWILVISLTNLIGYHGFALSLMIISWTLVIVVMLTKRYLPIVFYRQLVGPTLGASVMALFFAVSLQLIPHTLLFLVGVGIIGVGIYSGLLWYLDQARIRVLIELFTKRR